MTTDVSDPEPLDVSVRCSKCNQVATRVRLVATGDDSGAWRFLYSGIEAGNASGSVVDGVEAARIRHAFTEPLSFERVRTAKLHDNAGFCAQCGVAYCRDHWSPSDTGSGTCPRGHWVSLDPHWWPDFDALDNWPARRPGSTPQP